MDILATKYEIEKFYFDPYQDDETTFQSLKKENYDVVVLWQIYPDMELLKSYVQASQFVFFPMYDSSGGCGSEFWETYQNVKIINFSKTLHEKLLSWGLDSKYIQYFPKPAEKPIIADEKKIYFWQRINQINIKTVEKLFKKIGFNEIHIHKAIDPKHKFVEPSKQINNKITYSTWYDKKEDMIADIQNAGIYVAPRLYEGIGMSFLEAMAMGKCVVAPNYPTMNEYISNGETGILYDIKRLKPLTPFNTQKIAQQAYEYIKSGFDRWEKEKFNILTWIEEPIKVDCKKLIKARTAVYRYKILGVLPFLTVKKSFQKTGYLLFGVIPFYLLKQKENTRIHALFSIPFLKIKLKKGGKNVSYSLFNFVILKISKKGSPYL